MFDQIDSVIHFIHDKFSFMCCIFFLMYSRAGLNLLEEKARKKMSNHGYNSLSAAQVGSSDSSTHSDNDFLLLTLFSSSLDVLISPKKFVNSLFSFLLLVRR